MRYLPLKLAACCLALSACVTINVYFPAAAAEKAADKIIEDVWGEGQSDAEVGRQARRDHRAAMSRDCCSRPPVRRWTCSCRPRTHRRDLNIATPAVVN